MSTDSEFTDEIIADLREHRVWFVHSPRMWIEDDLPVALRWEPVKFLEEFLGQVPDDQLGLYAFMLEPSLEGVPKSAYLMYIGKTSRSFQERYDEYLKKELRRFGRTLIGRMLERWYGHLWFYYAPVEDPELIHEIEKALIRACVPPYNQKFEGKYGPQMTAFRQVLATEG